VGVDAHKARYALSTFHDGPPFLGFFLFYRSARLSYYQSLTFDNLMLNRD